MKRRSRPGPRSPASLAAAMRSACSRWACDAAEPVNYPDALPCAGAGQPMLPPASCLPPPPLPPLPLPQVRLDIEQRTQALLAQGPAYLAKRTLNDLNAEAAAHQKAGEHAAAIAVYAALFTKARQSNLTHPELYICHSNCAAAYLALGLHSEALQQADKCQRLAEASLRRWARGPCWRATQWWGHACS